VCVKFLLAYLTKNAAYTTCVYAVLPAGVSFQWFQQLEVFFALLDFLALEL